MLKPVILAATHALAAIVGFAAGIYALPILTAPPGADMETVTSAASTAAYTGEFRRDLAGSDALHWGEGSVFVGPDHVTLAGRIAPGPDYRLYLSPRFVETEDEFEQVCAGMREIGPVRSFENFRIPLPADVDLGSYDSVIVWCESFGEFITAARYRDAP